MQKSSYGLVTVITAALVFTGSALAQQTPATTPQPSPAAGSQSNSTLTTQKDKVSYAIGMNVGTNLHRQSVDVDPKILQQGLEDALSGGKTLLSEDEAKATLMQFQTEMRQKQQEKMQQAGAANKKEGDAFLAANKSKDGVVTLPSGLQYKIMTAGTGPKPKSSDSVVCNYKGTLIDGKEFDSSYKRGQPATFPVAGVIKGWTEALQLMPVGSKWQLFVPADLAYGERGSGPDIGPNATLIFEVELLSIQSKDKDKAGDQEKK
ncbi:MAG TPA: FKBP-type peptidyl-prolyl cis-trans isomerase [Terriglobales bacterium]|jgi:FKBP-type peptidyl-prolyl cis-trans isomerase FklB|nr:FKBP-type peptidyl-prolyl cis-trans isomerase [Terriglobales bacterium]